MDIQYVFQKRLKQHGITIYFYGTTSIESRWEQIRAAIVGSNFGPTKFGTRADGSVETYSEIFERTAGFPLTQSEGKAA